MPRPTQEQRKHLIKDPGWRAALTIFESAFGAHDGVWPYVDPVDQSIDWRLREAGWSHGEALLLDAARSLYNGSASVKLDEIVGVLDEPSFSVFLEALMQAKSNDRPRGAATFLNKRR